MTMTRSLELKAAIFQSLSTTMEPIIVSSVPLGIPRYVRLEGFIVDPRPDYRNYDLADHSFFVHVFDSPPGGTNSGKWAQTTLIACDQALKGMSLPGSTRLSMEDATLSFDPRSDGLFGAHALAQYRITIGD